MGITPTPWNCAFLDVGTKSPKMKFALHGFAASRSAYSVNNTEIMMEKNNVNV